jgi:hypothetical protein
LFDVFDTLTWAEILVKTTFLGTPTLTVPTKHIEIQEHFIHEKVQFGEIEVSFIPTSMQQAIFLTKLLSYTQFILNREDAGIKLLL